MSEEEKEAIEYWKNYMDILHCNTQLASEHHMSVLLNLIEKLQRIMKSQETIIMEQEKEIDNYKKQEFGNLFNGRYVRKDKIRDKIKKLKELYEKEMKPYQTEFGLNLSLLTKKEKEEVINKRNSLLTQIATLKDLLGE